MPDPMHRPHHEQSDALKRLLAEQRPTPRWLYRLRRALRPAIAIASSIAAPIGLAILILLGVHSCATNAAAQPLDIDRLIPALVQVESAGNPRAVGDGGKALGALQIWSVVVQDVNRAHGTRYTHRDAFDPAKAEAICRLYLAIYCTPKRLGRQPTMEDAARIWNGGPTGWKKKATVSYWQKVARVL
ncbi:MAG TPA: transglycosylase SLT domain-containing protein [Burkholderiaceae bacterium]|nr:transglycosylase SLT domain-containing protein [Burkholderiaceae bacterium]